MTFFLEYNFWSDLVQGVIDEQEEGPVERDVEEGGHQPGEVHIRAKKTTSFNQNLGNDEEEEFLIERKRIAVMAKWLLVLQTIELQS